MMRFAVILCVLVTLGSSMAAPHDAATGMEEIHKFHEECNKETGLNHEEFKKAIMEGTSDEKVKEHAICIAQKIGVIGDDNKIDKTVAKEHFETVFPEVADEIMEGCFADEEITKETVLDVTKCIFDKTKSGEN